QEEITPLCACGSIEEPYDMLRPHAVRFRVSSDITEISFEDAIRGPITFKRDQLHDFIIVRRDGVPIYNFVVVLDDIFMRITHVIRGEDHISNTPKQILIYLALEAKIPVFVHLPLILGSSGQRLSKRDAAVSVEEYRNQGFLAEALFNYLVRLGWAHGDQEVFSKKELVEFFSLEAISKKGAIFDLKKLLWLNKVYLQNASVQQLEEAIINLDSQKAIDLKKLWSEELCNRLLLLYAQKAATLLEVIVGPLELAHDPQELDLSLIAKWRTDITHKLISAFIEAIQKNNDFTHEKIMSIGKDIVAQHNTLLVNLAQPLRLGIVGGIVSPSIFELMEILGKETVVRRLMHLLKSFK
ncbi:MAG TPA: glutamate--tRNA ligase, partial [Candidatus Babeliales bacterium]|nr:glutamate--tRNA ligase [Candidatus Babeliales bacterium]